MLDFDIYSDGDFVPSEIEVKYNLRDLNLVLTKKNYLKLNFVGIVIKNDLPPLVVFPKHFLFERDSMINHTQLLLEVLKKHGQSGLSADLTDENISKVSNFPIKAYLDVCSYYNNYGLYFEEKKMTKPGYKGRINWQRTINKSPKILNSGNIIFMPFQIEYIENTNVFITKSMQEVLSHGHQIFGQFFGMGIKYLNKSPRSNSTQIQNTLRKLKSIKVHYFKDSTVSLINNLISYFEWRNNNHGKEIRLVTKNFDFIWEKMVHSYLSNYLIDIDTNMKSHVISFSENKINDEKLLKAKFRQPVLQNQNGERVFTMEFDHISISDHKQRIILFDSKYFNEIDGLEYKQVVYAYFLLNKYENYQLINGLILPTNEDYFSQVHIDRKNIDDIHITEHYLNMNKVMKSYIDI